MLISSFLNLFTLILTKIAASHLFLLLMGLIAALFTIKLFVRLLNV